MALTPGTRIGSYEVSAQIGVGGMGEVYRATDTNLGRAVAIKVLPESVAQDQERLARFDREARTLASLNHPNIATIHGIERSDGTTALVMELVEGPTLADRIAQGAIPVDEALPIARQIAEALEAAHEQGVVHRDLKPANIKLRPDGTVKVLDFGLAKAPEPNAAGAAAGNLSMSPTLTTPAMTQAGIILGTAAYMSPEQARGEPVDKRADIWAFGCVLFEMLTGRPVFQARDVSTILARVLEREPDFGGLPPDLNARVLETLEGCLQKTTARRYHDIGDVRRDIEKALADPAGLRVSPPAAAVQVRSSVLSWVAAIVLAILAGAAAWYLKPSPTRISTVVTRFDHVVTEAVAFRDATRDVIAISPDGRYFVYNVATGLYLRSMDDTEARLLPGTQTALTNPFFSPDGESIGFWDGVDGQLKRMPIDGGAPVSLTGAVNPQGASWASDDTIVYGQPDGIMRVSENGGDPRLVVAAAAGEQLWDPQVLPDGSILFVSVTGTTGTIAVQAPGSAERTNLFPGQRAVFVPTGHLIATDPVAAPGTLLARSFDLETLAVGSPVSVEEGLLYVNRRTHFALSNSGTLVFAGSGSAIQGDVLLALADRAGSVTRLRVDPGQYRGPRVSPDGTEVAVEIIGDNGRSAVWIYDLSGRRAFRRLLGAGSNMRPIWTPDGTRITFASDRDGTWGIYWQPADGSGRAERLTTAEPGVEHWPDSWSEDTRTLAFTRIEGSLDSILSQTIWVVGLDQEGRAGEPEELVPVSAGGATFSPGGEWIAYRSADSALGPTNQIHVQPFPPTGAFYAVTEDGGAYPMWSRDGRELLYRRPAVGFGTTSSALASVEVTTRGSFAWGDERIIPLVGFLSFFGFRDYDIMPDGERFVMVVSQEGSAVPNTQLSLLHVVSNWFEDLNARVPVF